MLFANRKKRLNSLLKNYVQKSLFPRSFMITVQHEFKDMKKQTDELFYKKGI